MSECYSTGGSSEQLNTVAGQEVLATQSDTEIYYIGAGENFLEFTPGNGVEIETGEASYELCAESAEEIITLNEGPSGPQGPPGDGGSVFSETVIDPSSVPFKVLVNATAGTSVGKVTVVIDAEWNGNPVLTVGYDSSTEEYVTVKQVSLLRSVNTRFDIYQSELQLPFDTEIKAYLSGVGTTGSARVFVNYNP